MKKLKVMTVVGTRPEIIRLSATIKLLDKYTNQIFVHTGQNYDYELNEIFFEDLGLRKPDHFMNVDTSTLGSAIGDIFKKTEEIINLEKPDALLVLGDTNSCLSAYMAKRKHIPIFHMEAGNRSFDFNVPEEVNRRIIDHIADFNLVYTEHARRHLIAEGLQHRRIYLTGSPMWEVIQQNMEKIQNSDILKRLSDQIRDEGVQRLNHPLSNIQSASEEKNPRVSVESVLSVFHSLQSQKYFMVSVHREENVDNPENLKKILTVLNKLAETYNLPVIVSTHPRTRKRIENQWSSVESEVNMSQNKIREEGATRLYNQSDIIQSASEEKNPRASVSSVSSVFHPLIHFMKPFGFTDYINLQINALCTISDSGTISEESSMLSFPAISLRQSMERPEAQDAGTIILTGFDSDVVLNSVKMTIEEQSISKYKSIAHEYQIDNTSIRVVKLILGNTKLSNKWWGVK